MKKIILLSIFSILIVTKGFTQVKVNLTTQNVSPDFYEVHLPFLSINFASTNSTFNADFGGSIKKGAFYADADLRISYVNGLEEFIYNIEEPKANSIYDYRSPKSFMVNGGYMFVQNEVDYKVPFNVKSSGNTRYYTEVDGQRTNFWMANLGYKKGYDWVSCKGKELKFEGNAPAGFYPPLPEETRTMMDYSTLIVGVTMGKMGYWEADIEDYGHRKTTQFVRYYLNLLYQVESEIDPVYYERVADNNSQDKVYSQFTLDNSPRNNVGFCLGASTTNFSKFGFGGGVELGYYPGIKGSFESCFGISVKTTLSFGNVFNN